MGDNAGFWYRLREFAARVRIDSISVGPARIRFQPGQSGTDAFAAIVAKLARTEGRPCDVFVVSAHNIDEVTVVDEITADHECEALQPTQRHPGGSGANTAFVLAQLGANVEVAGVVACDDDGRTLLRALRDAGVATNLVLEIPKSVSGRTQNIVDLRGRRLLVVHPNVNDTFVDSLSEEVLLQAASVTRVLHLSSFVDERVLPLQTTVARSVHHDTVVTLAPGALYARRGLDRLASLLASVDVIFLYREQLSRLIDTSSARSGSTNDSIQDMLHGYFSWKTDRQLPNPQVVIVKDPVNNNHQREVRERFLAVGSGTTHLERFFYPKQLPHQADIKALDSTGAGDAAAAAFLYGMLEGGSMEACLDAAFMLACFASTAIGARAAFSSTDSVTAITDGSRW